MAINPTEFANVQLTDDFNTWRTRTNKTLAAFSTNTFTTSNTVHSNGTPKAITFGHGVLEGSLSANQLYANTYLSGGEFGNPDTLTITTNNYTYGKLTVANNATIGIDGEDELFSKARLRVTANATFRDIVRMDADVYIGTANTDTLVVNAVSTFDGEATFRDDVVVTANVDITGDSVNITGNTIVGSANTDTLTINATTDINAATNIDGNVTATGKVTINGNTVVGNANTDTLTVGADTTFNGPVTLNGVTDVSGAMVFNGNTTLGNASTDKLIVPSHSVFQSNVTVGGAASDKLLVTGHAQLSSNLIVEGTTKLNGGTTIGNATGDDLTVTARVASSFVPKTDGVHTLGTTSLRWEGLFADSVTAGNAALSGTLDVTGDTTVDGATTLNGNVILGNANTDAVTINGTTEINGTTTIDGVTTITGGASVNGNTTIGSANNDTLTVQATSTFNSNSTFHGEVGFYGNTDFQSDVNIEGGLSLGDGFNLSATKGIYDDILVKDHTVLGSAAADTVHFKATVNSAIIPVSNNTKDLGSSSKQWKDLYVDGTAYLDVINFNGTNITSTAAEINKLDGFTGTFADLNYAKDLNATGVTSTEFNTALDGITATAAELNTMDGITATTSELNTMDGITSTVAELNTLDGYTGSVTELNYAKALYDTGVTSTEFNTALDGITATAAELNLLDGVSGLVQADFTKLAAVNASASELNILDGVTATASELNKLDGVTSTTAELNKVDGYTGSATELNYAKSLYDTGVTSTEFNTALDGITATAAELNKLDGATVTVTEINKLDGFTGSATDLNYAKDLRATGVTSTEFDYLDGVTSNIQTQFNSKLNLSGGTLTGTLTSRSITPSAHASYDLGTTSVKFRNYYASGEFFGTATNAKFADLAEKYVADADYEEGTVIVVGGEAEVTSSTEETNHSVIGVVSTNPAFKMNSELENGTYIALKGRVPVKILGEVSKGDRLVATDNGCAKTTRSSEWTFAIALEDGTDGTIEAVIL